LPEDTAERNGSTCDVEMKSEDSSAAPSSASSPYAAARILALRCPATGSKANYMYVHSSGSSSTSSGGVLCEISRVAGRIPPGRRDPAPSSWFIDESVKSDGSMLVTTPVDPVFILLDILSTGRSAEQMGKFSPFSQIIEQVIPAFPHYRYLLGLFNASLMETLCEVNSDYGPDMLLVRLDEKKVASWLEKKVKAIVGALKGIPEFADEARGCSVAPELQSIVGSQTSAKKELGVQDLDEDALKRSAMQFLVEYLPRTWQEKLAAANGTTLKAIVEDENHANKENGKKRKTWEEKHGYGNQNDKLHRMLLGQDINQNNGAAAKAKPEVKSAASQGVKRLKKVNTKGMRKMSAFFKRK